jgi:hypothetical protein
MKNIKIISSVLLSISLCCSCERNTSNTTKEYYFVEYNTYNGRPDIAKKYVIQRIKEINSKRKIINVVYDVDCNSLNVYFELYAVKLVGLIKYLGLPDTIQIYYFTTFQDTCIIWNRPLLFDYPCPPDAVMEHCYLGKEKVSYNNDMDTIVAHKFFVRPFSWDFEEYHYYDDDFVLLKKVNIVNNFTIQERVDSIPYDFKRQIDLIDNSK